jgi:signal peptidase I
MRLLNAALAAALMVGCVSPSLFQGQEKTVVVRGITMLPTIKDGDRVRFLRIGREDELEVSRGDILEFYYPDDPSKLYIKRLIGLPGETVQLRGGKVFVNGEELPEPYVDPSLNKAVDDRAPVFVKPHYYFVMGDNRDNSSDSRTWGLVPEKYITGKAVGLPPARR